MSNHGGNDRLTIFSTAVEWAGQPATGANYPSHDKFGVIARALHGGDFTRAARWVLDTYPTIPTAITTPVATRERVIPPAVARLEPATPDEVETWLASYTRFTRPARLGRRVEWMREARPEDLFRHARALVSDAIEGYLPAERALRALRDACRASGGTDPAIVRDLTAHALGSILNATVTTP